MLSARQLASGLHGQLCGPDVQVTRIDYDSRLCQEGSAYFAFPGIHHDGDDFIQDALDHGARLVVSRNEPCGLGGGVAHIKVGGNIRSAYAKAVDLFFKHPSSRLEVIGVTGTDGKSSTCFYAYSLLKALGVKVGLLTTTSVDTGQGVVPSPWANTTPEAWDVEGSLVAAAEAGCTHFVLECSSHALSNVYDRLACIDFHSSAITRVSSEHLEFHGSLDAYLDAKARLYEKTRGLVFCYEGNSVMDHLTDRSRLVALTRPQVVSRNLSGLRFRLRGRDYSLPFFQDYALENAFEAACLVAQAAGKELDEVLSHLGGLANPPGRCEMLKSPRGFLAVIDFAHTPDAMDRIFSSFRQVTQGGFIALFGSSGERDRSKRRAMGEVAGRWCRQIVLSEDDPRAEGAESIAREIANGITGRAQCRFIERREEAVAYALSLAREDDVVFLLGMGHERTLDYGDHKRAYDEGQVARKILKEMEK